MPKRDYTAEFLAAVKWPDAPQEFAEIVKLLREHDAEEQVQLLLSIGRRFAIEATQPRPESDESVN